MALVVPREDADLIVARTKRALARSARKADEPKPDVVTWSERNFYIEETGEPVVLEQWQKAVLLYAFPAALAYGFRFSTVVFSTVKKSGKTAIAGMVCRWVAEVRTRMGHVYTLGNDGKQAKERSFLAIAKSIALTPGFKQGRNNEGWLKGRWHTQVQKMHCYTTGTIVEAVGVDAAGEAGGAPDLTCWTELWGFIQQAAVSFFEEMTPIPTKPSCRLIETYAGIQGESELLERIYEQGMTDGRQLTAGELADDTGIPLGCFEEAPNREDLVPIWVNEEKGLFMFWDTGEQARRMPWQKGERGARYYTAQEAEHTPSQYRRFHHNEWTGRESDFVPIELWDARFDPALPMLEPGDKTPCVIGVDAATTHDCFAIVVVTRHPRSPADTIAVRQSRKWEPPKGGRIDYDGPEAFIRTLCRGGCMLGHPQYPPFLKEIELCEHRPENGRACKQCCAACRDGLLMERLNVMQVTYDAYQLENMMQHLRKDSIAWCKEFPQGGDRLEADKALYDLIVNGTIAHRGEPHMREHIQNAASKQSLHEDTKFRIMKKKGMQNRKIDLVVALSMASYNCLYLRLG